MFMLNLMQISNQCELVVTIKVPEIIFFVCLTKENGVS